MLSCVGYAILAYHEDSNVIVQDVLNSVLHFVVFQRGYFTHLSTSSKALLFACFGNSIVTDPFSNHNYSSAKNSYRASDIY